MAAPPPIIPDQVDPRPISRATSCSLYHPARKIHPNHLVFAASAQLRRLRNRVRSLQCRQMPSVLAAVETLDRDGVGDAGVIDAPGVPPVGVFGPTPG